MLGEQKLMAVMNTVHLYTRPFSLESLGNLREKHLNGLNFVLKLSHLGLQDPNGLRHGLHLGGLGGLTECREWSRVKHRGCLTECREWRRRRRGSRTGLRCTGCGRRRGRRGVRKRRSRHVVLLLRPWRKRRMVAYESVVHVDVIFPPSIPRGISSNSSL